MAVKVEVKNMNSFRSVYRALLYEMERQERLLREGERIEQETRGWLEDEETTVSQRSKEYAHDYRYFPEPDLPPMVIDRKWVEEIRSRLPELPDARFHRFTSQYQLPPKDAGVLVNSESMADFFEECIEIAKGGHGGDIIQGKGGQYLDAGRLCSIVECRRHPYQTVQDNTQVPL
jgi:aspartyl-tRNA(Asn)/glutamyl-tRNA(Gln) amidotransferase subunit B